jgi:tetratricopeptide (TPR) repeat protein
MSSHKSILSKSSLLKTNKLIFLFFSALIFCTKVTIAISTTEAKDQFTKGCEAYKNNDFSKALELFNAVAANYKSAELFYNLGNCNFKLNKLPEAILYYEKALKLNPGNEDADYNLKLANSQIVDKIDALPSLAIIKWWDNFKFSKGANYWGWLSILFAALAFILFVIFKVSYNLFFKRIGFYIGCLMIVLAMVSLLFAYQNHSFHSNENTAIIFAPKVDVKSAPSESGTNVFVLHEGTKVNILNNTDQWIEIVISNGNRGWMLKKKCSVI